MGVSVVVGMGSSVVVVGTSVVVVGASVVVLASAVVVVSELGVGDVVGFGVEDGVELACTELCEALGVEVKVLEVGLRLEEEVPEVPEVPEPDSSADDNGICPPAVASAGQSRF